MIPFTTAERKVLGVAAPTQAQAAASNRSIAAAPNPFGIQPKLTGYVNMIYVQARSADAVPERARAGDGERSARATTSARARPTTSACAT